ncbi:MAG: ABC transporter ATP-binding protein [Candidatus Thorarchaeota archaeon SMTZ1-45]|nr:MAG: hypothetical protein AM325_06985 [Candidatus Thorarchaeota archaeon SMTZ1-45]
MVATSDEITLKVENLRAYYTSKKGLVKAVNNVSFEVRKGESVGLFGESGAGKTSVALAILGMFDNLSRYYASTAANEENKRLWALKDEALDDKEYKRILGNEITYVPQGTTKSLNPYSNIEEQTAEVLWAHDEDDELEEWQVMKRVLQTLDLVELGDVDIRKDMKPSQFSVGEDQRVLIAIALVSHPDLMIADEPTTAVDMGLQNRILDAIQIVRDELDLSMLLISNNQGTIAKTCDRVGVMTAGHIVEFGDTERVLNSPGHPFTRAFIMSNPSMELIRKIKEKGLRIRGIPGKPPDLSNPPRGCPFSERCDYVQDICREKMPEYREIDKDYWILCHRYEELPEW